MKAETPKELSVRIHIDWLYQCRTCEHWDGRREFLPLGESENGHCINNKSPLFKECTSSCGHCECWDSYDYETALELFDGKWNHLFLP